VGVFLAAQLVIGGPVERIAVACFEALPVVLEGCLYLVGGCAGAKKEMLGKCNLHLPTSA